MRKRISRWLAVALILVMGAALLGACGGKQQAAQQPSTPQPQPQEQAQSQPVEPKPAPDTPKPKVGVLYSVANPANAGGWDRANFVGQSYLSDKMGWQINVAEEVPYPELVNTAAQYADKGYEMVIFTSNGMADAMKEVAPKYPKTWFVMMSLIDELPTADNVVAYSPDFFSYGAIVGVVAARASKSGVIGVSGGVPIPVLHTMYSGIIEGAKAVRPDSKVIVSWVGDWVDLAKHREVTLLQAQQGADVFFTVSGPGTNGVYDGARSKGATVIGYAADWYKDAPEAILTSVIVDIAKAYEVMSADYNAGKLTRNINRMGPEYFTLADFHGKLDPAVEKEVRDLVAKIQSGELKIPVVMHDEIMNQ